MKFCSVSFAELVEAGDTRNETWSWMREAGIEVPGVPDARSRPFTPASTRRCATVVLCAGSAWSSSPTSSNLTFLPPIVTPLALASPMARRVPFSRSR